MTSPKTAAAPQGQPPQALPRDKALALGRELQILAATQASMDHDFCQLVDRFDQTGAISFFAGMKSTAHYLAWSCSMHASVAREHVRVARALRTMPQTTELFRQGRFSYSKVRELTRLVGVVDEVELCALALELTASQLARTVSSFRLAAGSRIRALPERRYSSRPTGDGMVRITVVLPAEQAALIDAAVEAATRAIPEQDRVQALVDVAATYLESPPREPADDHTLVMVHVHASALDVPAGTSSHVPDTVGPSTLESGTCFVEGHGPIEPATAARLLCTATAQGVVVAGSGHVLHLGRARRLASRAQRRALRVRDKGICQFPGCASVSHLDAHHIVPWSHGGATDLHNLILLCGRHHTLVHEGGLRIDRAAETSARPWEFFMPDGLRVDADGYHAWRAVDDITRVLAAISERSAATDPVGRVFPAHGGHGFSLHECVRVLFAATGDLPADPTPDSVAA